MESVAARLCMVVSSVARRWRAAASRTSIVVGNSAGLFIIPSLPVFVKAENRPQRIQPGVLTAFTKSTMLVLVSWRIFLPSGSTVRTRRWKERAKSGSVSADAGPGRRSK